MNVKVSIELPERYLEFAEDMVRDGAYGSLSELVEGASPRPDAGQA